MMNKIVYYFTLLLSRIIPVKNNLLLFVSGFNYCDNSYAVFRYMLENEGFDKYSFCWLVDDLTKYKTIIYNDVDSLLQGRQLLVIKRKSLLGIWYAFRARYIFNTTGLFISIHFYQKDKRINMWHGMPIKRIYSKGSNGDVSVAMSPLFVPFMSQGLNIPIEKILLVGQPRNDMLFRRDLISFDFINKFKSIGIWMPTFRRSILGNYHDGQYNEDYISFVSFRQLNELNNYLAKLDSLLIVKFHPLDVLQNKKVENLSNIIFYNNNNFLMKDLYPLLGLCKYLLTDYSSVAIDFEVLNRPIGFTLGDVEEYGKSRGFSIDEFPGECLYNFEEMIKFIREALAGKVIQKDYGQKFNVYKDSNSTYRLLSQLGFC